MDELDLLRRKLARERRARAEAETLIEQKSLDLYRAKLSAELANRAKTEFLANMSHELRTPLNAIMGFSEILLEGTFGPINEKQTEYLGLVLASGQRLSDILLQIFEMCRLEGGEIDLDCGAVDMAEVVQRAMDCTARKAGDRGIAIEREIDSRAARVWGETGAIHRIVVNVLDNAIKFSHDGGTVRISAGIAGDGAPRLSIIDRGAGIPAEDIAKVVEPFMQADSGMNRLHEGAGLGLSIARGLATAMGARLAITSTVGVGTRVAVTFQSVPVNIEEETAAGADRLADAG